MWPQKYCLWSILFSLQIKEIEKTIIYLDRQRRNRKKINRKFPFLLLNFLILFLGVVSQTESGTLHIKKTLMLTSDQQKFLWSFKECKWSDLKLRQNAYKYKFDLQSPMHCILWYRLALNFGKGFNSFQKDFITVESQNLPPLYP